MTARQRNYATSDNSVPRLPQADTETVTLQRDSRFRSIVRHIKNRNRTVTATDIATKADWTRDKTGDHLSRTRTADLMQRPDDLQELVLRLAAKGEYFTQEADL